MFLSSFVRLYLSHMLKCAVAVVANNWSQICNMEVRNYLCVTHQSKYRFFLHCYWWNMHENVSNNPSLGLTFHLPVGVAD